MTDQSLFNNSNTTNQETTDNNTTSNATEKTGGATETTPFEDLLKSVVNERGEQKYKDVPTALEGLSHSQKFIGTLQSENSELKDKLSDLEKKVSELKTVEETVAALTSGKNITKENPPHVISEENVAELIERTLNNKNAESLRKSNVNLVTQSVKEQFGEKAESEFYSRAADAGLSAEQVNKLAAESPKAVLKLLGINEREDRRTESNPTINPSSVNTSGIQPQKDTFVKRNDKGALIGASSHDQIEEMKNSQKLVEELDKEGLSVHDLANPKNYRKVFGN